MNNQPLITTASFKLGVFGTHITQEFSTRIEKLGLSHKQVGLLAIVDAGLANSQRDIATQLGIAPSLVVALADQLVERGAITRARSTTDRRIQIVQLTPAGTQLLHECTTIAHQLDQEIRRRLLQPALKTNYWWKHSRMNWTPWICSNWLTAVLICENDETRKVS